MLVALEDVHALDLGHVGLARHPLREHELLRAQHDVGPVALDGHDPLALLLVVLRALGGRGAPVVELHHPRVHLQPVADLVLRREHGPVLGELDVGQVVVPDRVVQAERLVALAPGVAGALVALDDDRRDAELAQPRAEPDPALAAADDHDVGLARVPELLGLAAAGLQPGLAVAVGAVLDAVRARGAARLLEALELAQRGQHGPRLAVLEPQQAVAAAGLRLELEPGVGDAVGLGRRLGGGEAARLGARERRLEHVLDALRPLDGLEVPREGDEVAPVAVVEEQLGRRRGVTARERVLEAREPLVHLDGRLGDGPGHLSSSTRTARRSIPPASLSVAPRCAVWPAATPGPRRSRSA